MVWRAAAAEYDTTVGGGLGVDPQVPHVVESDPVVQIQRISDIDGQRLGGKYQRVQRREGASLARQFGSESLCGTDDVGGADAAAVCFDLSGSDGMNSGAFIDGHAETLDEGGEA